MCQHLPGKLARGLHVMWLVAFVGVFMSAGPSMAMDPPSTCEPGTFSAHDAISFSLLGPTAPIDAGQEAVFTAASLTDADYCTQSRTHLYDTVDTFTWYIDGTVYPAGNDLAQVTLTFTTPGAHTVRVVADDHPDYANDASVQHEMTVQVLEYTYGKNGERATSADSRGMTTYEYDVLGRLTKVTEPDGKWIAYKYDGNSRRTKMTVHLSTSPLVEHLTDYVYNDRNLLWKVYDQLAERDGNGDPTTNAVCTTYYYKDNGLVDSITYPNLTKAIHSYNSRNWLTRISNQKSDDTIIAQFDYTYDTTYWGKNGTRTRVEENILKPDGTTRIEAQVDYEYDVLYRLVHEHRIAHDGGDPGVAYEYNFTYDAAGNRTAWQVVGGATTYYHCDVANKLTDYGSSNTSPYTGNAVVTYDVKGNTTQIVSGASTTSYTWDFKNRMTQWAKTGQTTETYVYNAFGMRVRKTPSGGTATGFILDRREIAEEITGSNDISYVGPGLISQISGTTRTVYHADGIGSTRAISDGDEDVAEAGVYDAYGNLVVSSGTTPSFGFAGQYTYYADATGLDYLKARYYQPSIGRFVSRDPIGYAGGRNLYRYAGDSPTNYVDPTGYYWYPIAGCVIGGMYEYAKDKDKGGSEKSVDCAAACGCLAGAAATIPVRRIVTLIGIPALPTLYDKCYAACMKVFPTPCFAPASAAPGDAPYAAPWPDPMHIHDRTGRY